MASTANIETKNKYGRCNDCVTTNDTKFDTSGNTITSKRIDNKVRVSSSLYTMNLAALNYSKKKPNDYLPCTNNKSSTNAYVGIARHLRSRTATKSSPGNSKYGSYDRYLMKKKKGYFVLDSNSNNNGIVNTICTNTYCEEKDYKNKES